MAPPYILDSVVNGRAADPSPRCQRACPRSPRSARPAPPAQPIKPCGGKRSLRDHAHERALLLWPKSLLGGRISRRMPKPLAFPCGAQTAARAMALLGRAHQAKADRGSASGATAGDPGYLTPMRPRGRLVIRHSASDRWRCGRPGAHLGSRRADDNAQRSDAGWATARDRFPCRVVERRPVVEMAPPSMLDSVVNGRAADPSPRCQRACPRSRRPRSPQHSQRRTLLPPRARLERRDDRKAMAGVRPTCARSSVRRSARPCASIRTRSRCCSRTRRWSTRSRPS